MRIFQGIRKPRNPIPGIIFGEEVEAIGAKTKQFKVNDNGYGMTGFRLGCFAEYLCIKEIDSMAGCISYMPQNIGFEEATAGVYGGLLVLQYLKTGSIHHAKNVLIYGASGTCGTIAVQLAKHFGAEVTGISSTTNLALVKSLGADHVIDYTQTTRIEPGTEFDLILDAVGHRKTSLLKKTCKNALSKGGKYVSIDDGSMQMNSERLARITTMIEAGNFKPVLDKTYPMDQIVESHHYVGKGHKKGGVAIQIA